MRPSCREASEQGSGLVRAAGLELLVGLEPGRGAHARREEARTAGGPRLLLGAVGGRQQAVVRIVALAPSPMLAELVEVAGADERHDEDGRPPHGVADDGEEARRRHADGYVGHGDPPAARGDAIDAERGDGATVQRECGHQVDQPDDRSGPPDGVAGRRRGDGVQRERVRPHGQQEDDAEHDLDRRSGHRDQGPLPPGQRPAGEVGGVAVEEVESDGGVGAEPAGHPGVAELVDQGEDGQRGRPATARAIRRRGTRSGR